MNMKPTLLELITRGLSEDLVSRQGCRVHFLLGPRHYRGMSE